MIHNILYQYNIMYRNKYLKYKLKYINLKSHNKHNMLGGADKNENNTLYLFKAALTLA